MKTSQIALNSHLMWIKNNPNRNSVSKFRRRRRLFLTDLSTSLMESFMLRRAQQARLQSSVRQALGACGLNVPMQQNEARDETSRGRCHLCRLRNQVKVLRTLCQRFAYKEHSERKTVCNSCFKDVHLCVLDIFKNN